MLAALALILLADAATCPPGAPAPLAGGAKLVPPVGTTSPAPFQRLGPAIEIIPSAGVYPTGAQGEVEAPVRCEAEFSAIA